VPRIGAVDGVADEPLHLGLAERGGARADEPARVSLAAGDAEPATVYLDRRRGALEHGHAGVAQPALQGPCAVGLEVVVAEHGDDGHRHALQLRGQHIRLLDLAALREVPGEQQHVCLRTDPGEVRPDLPA
jgi:hypothetical protein